MLKKRLAVILLILAMTLLSRPQLGQAQEPAECEFEYTVQAGDWLSKIAEKYYDDIMAYVAIV